MFVHLFCVSAGLVDIKPKFKQLDCTDSLQVHGLVEKEVDLQCLVRSLVEIGRDASDAVVEMNKHEVNEFLSRQIYGRLKHDNTWQWVYTQQQSPQFETGLEKIYIIRRDPPPYMKQ